jgi:hypothetical protein
MIAKLAAQLEVDLRQPFHRSRSILNSARSFLVARPMMAYENSG